MKTLDADAILARATPLGHQEAFLAEHVIDVPLVRA